MSFDELRHFFTARHSFTVKIALLDTGATMHVDNVLRSTEEVVVIATGGHAQRNARAIRHAYHFGKPGVFGESNLSSFAMRLPEWVSCD